MIKKQICDVCKEKDFKYRCPKCKIIYCSLDCYKQHKETCSPVTLKENAAPSLENVPQEARVTVHDFQLDEDSTEDKVSPEQLHNLDCSQVQAMLNNPHLRQMMRSLVEAKSPAKTLESAMQEPIFTEFADKCLAVIDNQPDIDVSDDEI